MKGPMITSGQTIGHYASYSLRLIFLWRKRIIAHVAVSAIGAIQVMLHAVKRACTDSSHGERKYVQENPSTCVIK
jgi:hypothetical protein